MSWVVGFSAGNAVMMDIRDYIGDYGAADVDGISTSSTR